VRPRIRWRPFAGLLAATSLSALLLGLYARGGMAWPLGFIVLVPWLLALTTQRGWLSALCAGWAMSVGYVAAVFAWFGFAFAAYLDLSETTGLLVLLAVAPLLQPQVLVYALVRHGVGLRYGWTVRTLAGAAAWVAAEWCLPKLLGDSLGHALYPSRVLRQAADLGGVAGLSFALILINECIAAAIARRGDGLRAALRPLAIALSICAAIGGYGLLRLSMLAAAPSNEPPLRVGMIQTNLVDYEDRRRAQGAYAVIRQALQTHYGMSQEAIERHRVDALLWAETVYPMAFEHPKGALGAKFDAEIRAFVDWARVPLVFGTYDLDAQGEYNAAAFVEPGQGTRGVYRKTRLFLFTEFVPEWLDGPRFRAWFPWTGTWRPGTGAQVFPLRLADGREIPVQALICLDDTDPSLAIDGARLGARVILGLSNDSWFTRHPQGAELHLAVAAFRSIETRRPQLRVTNNGISAVVDATGEVVARTGMGERRILIGEAQLGPPRTSLMSFWGDWVGRAALLGLLGLLVWPLLRRRWARAEGDGSKMTGAGAAYGARTQTTSDTVPEIATDAVSAFRADAIVLSPIWRAAAAMLRLFARASLLWMAIVFPLAWNIQEVNPLTRIEWFAALCLAPELAAWAILRAGAATMTIVDGHLILEQRERRIEIALSEVVALDRWIVPLPMPGAWLRLSSGQRWRQGIAIRDPMAWIDAMIRAGANPALIDAFPGRIGQYFRVRASVRRGRLDHPLAKFVLFPLVPMLPAFRLHQYIAYGGTFGEYQSFGLQAYLSAFGIWWASWAIGMTLFAAALRVAIELFTLISLAAAPQWTGAVRRGLEWVARVAYYLGVPALLLLRLFAA